MSKRVKTNYVGVYYREIPRVGRTGTERMYYVVFRKAGKVHEEKVGRQYADAMTPARAARVRAERIEGKRLSPKEMRALRRAQKEAEANRWTIGRLWTEYKAQRNPKGLAQDESRYKKYIHPLLGHKEPRTILPLDVDRMRLKMLKGKSLQTVKLVLALLRRIVNFGVTKRLSDPMPFVIEMPKVHSEKTEDLTDEQLGRLLEVIEKDENHQAANLMKLVLFTGMRKSELFKLEWGDIDFQRGFILIRDPKGTRDEKVPLNNGAREILTSHPRTDSPYVFPGRDGKQRTEIRRPVNRIKKKAGLPKDFRPLHGLRHTFASMLASSGKVDLYTLQKLLTHKTPGMTQRYAHLRDEALKRGADVASDIVRDILSKR